MRIGSWLPEVRRLYEEHTWDILGRGAELAASVVMEARAAEDHGLALLLDSVGAALADPHPPIRRWLLIVVKMLVEEGIVHHLDQRFLDALDDPDWDVRDKACTLVAEAANVLGAKHRATVDRMWMVAHPTHDRFFRTSDEPVRALMALVGVSRSPVQLDPRTREAASQVIARVGDAQLRTPARRACAKLVLDDAHRAVLRDALPRMLADAATEEDLVAALALAATLPPAPAAVPRLRELVDHPIQHIREAAARELERGEPSYPAVLAARLAAFGDEDASVQRSALQIATVDELLLGLRDANPRARRTCAQRLFEVDVTGDARLVLDDLALEGLADTDPLVAAMCAALCGRLGERAAFAVDVIVPLSQHADEDVAAYATHALSKLMPFAPDKIVPALLRAALRTDRVGRMDMPSFLAQTTVDIDGELLEAGNSSALAPIVMEVIAKRSPR